MITYRPEGYMEARSYPIARDSPRDQRLTWGQGAYTLRPEAGSICEQSWELLTRYSPMVREEEKVSCPEASLYNNQSKVTVGHLRKGNIKPP
jgi:hypothetical protein